jgi:hypothetical protein|tara:strand:- start:342 stop:1259 length:918 start_codon:yes stop_codon:yes gene_type:complete
MAFKLGDKKFTLKSKGLLNMSPFKANGNTMAFNNVDTDPPKKPSTQAETDEAAMNNVVFDESTRTEVESDRPGFKKFRTTGTGDAEGYSKGTKKMGNKEWSEWLKTPAGQKYTASKNKEKFDYESEPKEPTEKTVITTSENPRERKTQDYITGEGDKVFAAPQTQRFMNLSKALTGKADSFGFKNLKGKQLKQAQDAYDKKVLDSRAKQGPMGAENLTLAEQKAKENINKIGAGTSEIVDTKSGEGLRKGEIAVKDGEGNMMYVNRKKGTSRPASPENDIEKQSRIKMPATTSDGKETTIYSSKV